MHGDNVTLDASDISATGAVRVTAARDLQRPPEATQAAFEAFGSADKTFVRAGLADGFSFDYGHDDLLAGLASPREIFPRIAGWLEERS